MLAASIIAAASARAATSTIGRTWPIAEPDALAEIEARTAKLPPDMRERFGPRSSWSAMKAASLAPATRNQTRSVVPFYTLDTDIRLPTGDLLYPKGYSFNPLEYVKLPQRLVVVHPRDLGWALKTARLTDFILLAAGGAHDDDAITLSERTGRAIYILEPRIKERLGLTVAPVIITQVGTRLELTEVRLESTARGAPNISQPVRRPAP
ncbi:MULTISPECIES: conjugal transfer protein TraW [Novosphingobium]|uniref:Conjugal transfer protein TraW n=1 Tax=Novosphingobium mangrovi (ex Huang et al. 2023) TaxID=2976432 RepID=A0ABT2I7U6_9SPHN|nr:MULTISPECIES: conjugal transfer protein TraW [Novosphingobium]MCT2400882.1 conjugal transfer protein TraW [Novosphingobium mangrovi (ex Huang et al. 2023)]CCA93235.1 conserved hypothetical cytosolic protein [Novosphingobium sp. PP1Y]